MIAAAIIGCSSTSKRYNIDVITTMYDRGKVYPIHDTTAMFAPNDSIATIKGHMEVYRVILLYHKSLSGPANLDSLPTIWDVSIFDDKWKRVLFPIPNQIENEIVLEARKRYR